MKLVLLLANVSKKENGAYLVPSLLNP